MEHSKANTNAIVAEICTNPKRMEELMDLFIDGPSKITQRAAWPLSFVAQQHPEYLTEYYSLLVKQLCNKETHPSVLRNILRSFQYTEIPKKHQGKVLNRSFELLNDNKIAIAIRVFSMTVIFNLTKSYPDIIPELRASIEKMLPDGSAGIKSRGKKILKLISKL